jgi:hypothetical protein
MTEQQQEIQRILAQYDNPAATNEPVLMIDIIAQQQARNMGFPKWLYHSHLEPVQIKNKEQENALRKEGYTTNYIHRSFPAFVFRRNMEAKFEDADMLSGAPGDFIEQRMVKSQEAFVALGKERKPRTVIGDWCFDLSELPPIAEGPKEDPAVTIARLQGQLQAMQREHVSETVSDAPKRGRPAKNVVSEEV